MIASESPVEEYERVLAARRAEAVQRIRSFTAWWAVLHPLSLFLLCAGLANVGSNPAALVGAGLVWALFMLPAIGATVAVLRDRAVLPVGWIVAGLTPWGVMLAELTPLLVAVFGLSI